MNKLRLGLAAILVMVVVLITSKSANAFQRVNANTVRIRVLSYNVKGLPVTINWGWDADRFADIGDILAARKAAGTQPDIVLLQEAFSPPTADVASHGRYPFVANGPMNDKLISSGIAILSNYPIDYQESIIYPDDVCGTWDCFASKGAMIARIQLPGVPFLLTMANTHAQSGEEWNDPRKTQLQSFAHFLKSIFNPNAGLIAGGDFNTNPKLPSYQDFKQRTGLKSVGELCVDQTNQCSLVGETNRDILLDSSDDQFFFVNGRQVSIRPVSVERNFLHPIKGRMLSDHPGYETVFEITWK